MSKKIIMLMSVFMEAILLAGTVFYFNGLLNDRNSKIELMNAQIANLNSQLSNLSSLVKNFATANLVTAIGATEVPKNSSINLPSVHLYNHLYISGSVTNTEEGTAYNAGLHVVGYDVNGRLRINMTVPLGGGMAAFGMDSEIMEYLGGGSSTVLRRLYAGETTGIDIAIFHRDTVSNWNITPIWTNFP